jgi:hypothetical protein
MLNLFLQSKTGAAQPVLWLISGHWMVVKTHFRPTDGYKPVFRTISGQPMLNIGSGHRMLNLFLQSKTDSAQPALW